MVEEVKQKKRFSSVSDVHPGKDFLEKIFRGGESGHSKIEGGVTWEI